MAKKRKATTQEPVSYPELSDIMVRETASILTDYIRQYVGIIGGPVEQPGSGIFMNFDRVLKTQTYQELAWFDLYDEVERDPHVSAIMRTLKLATASLEWRVAPADDSARSRAVAAFVEDVLKRMDNFTQDLYELMDAEGKGFAVSEVIWNVDFEARPVRLMNRPQRRFQFDAVTREPRLRTLTNPYYGEPLPERKFIVHRVSAKYENPFGDALDQSLYWMWLFKRTVLKYWMTHLDVASAPVPFVKHPDGANAALKAEALAIAESIRRGSYGRLPKSFDIEWASAFGAQLTAASYGNFVEMVNSEMTKCVLGQVLTTEGSAGGAGSKALGEVHSDVLALRAKYSAKALAATINTSLIKWVVDANYAGIDLYPRFEFVTEDPVDRKDEVEIIKGLKGAGFTPKREWVEEKIQVELEEKEEPPPMIPGEPPKGEKPQGEEETEPVEELEK